MPEDISSNHGHENWVAPDEATEKKFSPLEIIRNARKTAAGRLAEGVGAVALAVAAGLGGATEYEFMRGKASREEAWKIIEQESPAIHRIEYHTLSDVPAEKKAEILQTRDQQFLIQRQAGIEQLRSDLAKAGLSLEAIDSRVDSLLENLGDYRPSMYDRAIDEMGLPAVIDAPYPVIRFRSHMTGHTADGSVHIAGQHKPSSFIGPDTILVDPDSEYSGSILRHEDVHQRQDLLFGQTQDKISTQGTAANYLPSVRRNLYEGSAEYLRHRLDAACHLSFDESGYADQLAGVDIVAQTIGQEQYWDHFRHGKYIDMLKDVDRIGGPGTADYVFNRGAENLDMSAGFAKDEGRAYAHFHALTERGVLTADRIKHAREITNTRSFDDLDRFLVSRDGRFLGSMTVDDYAMHIAIDGPNGGMDVYGFPDQRADVSWTPIRRPISDFPALDKAYQQYQVRMKVAQTSVERQKILDQAREEIQRNLEQQRLK